MTKPIPSTCALAVAALLSTASGTPQDKKLVVAGSSVPRGYGAYTAGQYGGDFDQDGTIDYFATHGYAGRLRLLLTNPSDPTDPDDTTTAWTFENVSIGGNATSDLLSRFDPDVTRQYLAPKTVGSEPEYVLLGLSMGNEGLVFTSDPEQVFQSFENGMLQLIEDCRSRGYQPVVPLVYPHGLYTARKYEYVRRMNLLINSWDVPSINLLGAIDDGKGRWADGTLFDDAHPNTVGHEEMFYAIPPSLFDAMEAGKTSTPPFPSGSGFARIAADPGEPAPVTFEPSHTMHSFTTSFRVRSGTTGTVAAVRCANRPLFLVDFGPANVDDGRETPGPDAFGNHWNNWRPQNGGAVIPAGTTLPNLITVDNTATSVGLEVTDAFSASNGILNGGLFAPNGPNPVQLGDLAVETATEDYFFDLDTAAFKVTGLDPSKRYTFRFFGSRQSAETRETRFTLTGGLSYSPFSDIVTSGERIAANGIYNGNDNIIGMISSMPPDTNGEITVSMTSDNSTLSYLALMEISVDDATDRFGTIELRSDAIAYISPDGNEITAPVDGDGGIWHDVALAHRYARQETLLYVDGVLAGRLRENIVPERFVLGGPGAATRPAAPATADYQDWCVVRAAWNGDEALAQHEGALQQASLEILAPLDDASFSSGNPVSNTAQSLGEAVVNTPNVSPGPAVPAPGPLAAESYASSSVTLSWQDNSVTEGGFSIQRRPSGIGAAWEDVETTAANVTSFTDSGLTPGRSYDYRVASVEGGFSRDWSNIAHVAAGSDGQSYREWSAEFFNLPQSKYRIDFNAAAADYAGEIWNRVTLLDPPEALPLVDATGDGSAGYTLSVADGFDQFRTGNGSPLTDYPADAQSTFFAVTDQNQPEGARIVLSGLNRTSGYNVTLFGRRSPPTAGYDYGGRFTFIGSGPETSFEKDVSENEQIFGAFLAPDSAGNIVIDITAADTPSGLAFPGISFMVVDEIPSLTPEGAFLIDLNASTTSPSYPAGQTWNRIASVTDTTIHPMADISGSTTANLTYQVTGGFQETREGTAIPNGLADDAERTMFKAINAGSTITFGGLDPGAWYDITFLSHRGTPVAGFDYSAVCTAMGTGASSIVVDGAAGNYTTLSGIKPDAGGTIGLTIEAGPGAGTDFPVLNLVLLVPSVAPSAIDPDGDPDGDGVPNCNEYALGSDPLAADAIPITLDDPMVDNTQGTFSARFTRMLGARDIEWTVQTTTDLSNPFGWQTDANASESVVGRDGMLETIQVSRPLGTDPKRFFRLRMRFMPTP